MDHGRIIRMHFIIALTLDNLARTHSRSLLDRHTLALRLMMMEQIRTVAFRIAHIFDEKIENVMQVFHTIGAKFVTNEKIQWHA